MTELTEGQLAALRHMCDWYDKHADWNEGILIGDNEPLARACQTLIPLGLVEKLESGWPSHSRYFITRAGRKKVRR